MQHNSVFLVQIQQRRGCERFSPCLMQFELCSVLCSARYSRGRLTERTRGELEEEREGEKEGGEGEGKWDRQRANAPLDFQDVYLYCIIVLILKRFPWRMNTAQLFNVWNEYKRTVFLFSYNHTSVIWPMRGHKTLEIPHMWEKNMERQSKDTGLSVLICKNLEWNVTIWSTDIW